VVVDCGVDIQFLLNTFREIHSILFLLSEKDNLVVEGATEDIQNDKEVNDFLVFLVVVLYNHHDDILVTKAVMDRGSKDHPFPYEAEQGIAGVIHVAVVVRVMNIVCLQDYIGVAGMVGYSYILHDLDPSSRVCILLQG
jgi:hypothetical protein